MYCTRDKVKVGDGTSGSFILNLVLQGNHILKHEIKISKHKMFKILTLLTFPVG